MTYINLHTNSMDGVGNIIGNGMRLDWRPSTSDILNTYYVSAIIPVQLKMFVPYGTTALTVTYNCQYNTMFLSDKTTAGRMSVCWGKEITTAPVWVGNYSYVGSLVKGYEVTVGQDGTNMAVRLNPSAYITSGEWVYIYVVNSDSTSTHHQYITAYVNIDRTAYSTWYYKASWDSEGNPTTYTIPADDPNDPDDPIDPDDPDDPIVDPIDPIDPDDPDPDDPTDDPVTTGWQNLHLKSTNITGEVIGKGFKTDWVPSTSDTLNVYYAGVNVPVLFKMYIPTGTKELHLLYSCEYDSSTSVDITKTGRMAACWGEGIQYIPKWNGDESYEGRLIQGFEYDVSQLVKTMDIVLEAGAGVTSGAWLYIYIANYDADKTHKHYLNAYIVVDKEKYSNWYYQATFDSEGNPTTSSITPTTYDYIDPFLDALPSDPLQSILQTTVKYPQPWNLSDPYPWSQPFPYPFGE